MIPTTGPTGPATDTPTTGAANFRQIIRARARALMNARGYSFHGLSRAMGKSHTWVGRKLDDTASNPRGCDLGDVDLVLAALGADPLALMAPVLRRADLDALRYLAQPADAPPVSYGALDGHLDRLGLDRETWVFEMSSQGLITNGGPSNAYPVLTPLGLSSLATEPIDAAAA